MNQSYQYLIALVLVVLLALFAFTKFKDVVRKQVQITAEQMKGIGQ